MPYSDLKITVYVANLKKREDRLEHIKKEFHGKPEFDVNYVEAIEDKIGDIGLWKTLQYCVLQGRKNEEDVIVFCEDDHRFTSQYNKDFLFRNIFAASEKGCDLLIGGSTGGFDLTVPVSEHLIWINHYWSNQFIVIYSTFFDKILNHGNFDHKRKVDNTLSDLTMNKYILYPYISVQKVFGYSDVTPYNNERNHEIPRRFEISESRLGLVSAVHKHLS